MSHSNTILTLLMEQPLRRRTTGCTCGYHYCYRLAGSWHPANNKLFSSLITEIEIVSKNISFFGIRLLKWEYKALMVAIHFYTAISILERLQFAALQVSLRLKVSFAAVRKRQPNKSGLELA